MNKNIALISFVCSSVAAVLIACGSSKNVTELSENAAKNAGSSSVALDASNPFGTLIDSRDGQVYKTVKIKDQTWMAENLNFETEGSKCFQDIASNCALYGRMYSWGAAMDSSATFSANGKDCGMKVSCSPTYPVQGVCPAGWHLPSLDEWKTLFSLLEKKDTGGFSLRSKDAWNKIRSHKGTDEYGLCVLPAEAKFVNNAYRNTHVMADENTGFWTSSDFDALSAYVVSFYNEKVTTDQDYKHLNFYIRCVKDEVIQESDDSQNSASLSSSSVDLRYTGGSFTDARDGQTYKTTTIGSQTWMAENLNYKTPNSECWEEKVDATCDVQGRFYERNEAMTACPVGWHLPSSVEWNVLFSAVGGARVAGKALKSKMGWDGCNDCMNEYGFSAKSTGVAYSTVVFLDGDADFWSATEDDSHNPYCVFLEYDMDMAKMIKRGSLHRSSIRCVKDDAQKEMVRQTHQPVDDLKNASVSPSSVIRGSFTDARDGQTYKTTTIGSQTWMAQNLNYEVPQKSFCYGHIASNCAKYGQFYGLNVAMDVCPAGWHLPTPTEWEKLFDAVGGQLVATKALKSTKGWINGSNGKDLFGFSALPAGYGSGWGVAEGRSAYFWCSDESGNRHSYYVKMNYDDDSVDMDYVKESSYYSVRCVKDE